MDDPESDPDDLPRAERSIFCSWRGFYAFSFLAGCGAFAIGAWFVESPRREIAGFAAICLGIVGVLIWMRKRLALYAYLSTAVALIGYGVFRIWSAGYSHSRVGMIVGAVMMIASWRSVAEELD